VPLDLSAVVEDSLEMLRRLLGEDIQISAVLNDHLGIVEADPRPDPAGAGEPHGHARDAMPEGGHLVVETANVVIGEEYVSTRPEIAPGNYASLSVTDTGTGMSEEVLSHLFEPFFTTKPQGSGTGLGLATCHGSSSQSGGHIWVHSELGQGTTVTILLPQGATRPGGAGQVSAAQPPARGTETVLVVEDEPSVRRLAVLGLRSNGYLVWRPPTRPRRCASPPRAWHSPCRERRVMPGMRGPELRRVWAKSGRRRRYC